MPFVGGMAFLVVRAVVRALLPPGYHFRFVDPVLVKDESPDDEEE